MVPRRPRPSRSTLSIGTGSSGTSQYAVRISRVVEFDSGNESFLQHNVKKKLHLHSVSVKSAFKKCSGAFKKCSGVCKKRLRVCNKMSACLQNVAWTEQLKHFLG